MNLSTVCLLGILKLEEVAGSGGLGKLVSGGTKAQSELANLGNMGCGLVGVCAFLYMLINKEKGKELAIIVMIAAAGINLVMGGIVADIVDAWFGS